VSSSLGGAIAALLLGCSWPALGSVSARCAAQVTGKVMAAGSDSPVPGALAELWSDSGLVGRATSDDSGHFRLAGRSRGSALWLLVGRVGFSPAEVRSVLQGASYTISLRQLPVTLAALTITSCNRADDRVARGLWEAARRRYRLKPDTLLLVASVAYTRFRTTIEDSIGEADERESGGTGGYTSLGSRPWDHLVATRGYAVPRQPGAYLGDEMGAWDYLRLDDHNAEHFADSLFGALHVFLPAGEEDGLIVIPFCPRSTRHPDVEGALSLVPNGGFASAWWRFVVPHAKEEAGGQVFFAPLPDSGASFVIPARGLFWRRDERTSRYFEVMHVYDAWGIGADWYGRHVKEMEEN